MSDIYNTLERQASIFTAISIAIQLLIEYNSAGHNYRFFSITNGLKAVYFLLPISIL